MLNSQSVMMRGLNHFAASFERHWLAFVISALLVYTLVPFGAPVLMRAGYVNAAQFIYKPYLAACHTFGFRSFFLFGEQWTYPRGTVEEPDDFEHFSGIDLSTFLGPLDARDFQGNPHMGYKVALCERCLAIYLCLAMNGMIYALMRRRARMMSWPLFLLIGVLPIGLDGFSQLFSQPPFAVIPFRESTLFLRLLTGSLFGSSVAWLVFPLMDSTLGPQPTE